MVVIGEADAAGTATKTTWWQWNVRTPPEGRSWGLIRYITILTAIRGAWDGSSDQAKYATAPKIWVSRSQSGAFVSEHDRDWLCKVGMVQEPFSERSIHKRAVNRTYLVSTSFRSLDLRFNCPPCLEFKCDSCGLAVHKWLDPGRILLPFLRLSLVLETIESRDKHLAFGDNLSWNLGSKSRQYTFISDWQKCLTSSFSIFARRLIDTSSVRMTCFGFDFL